jgi:hypothetical protein
MTLFGSGEKKGFKRLMVIGMVWQDFCERELKFNIDNASGNNKVFYQVNYMMVYKVIIFNG